MKFLLIAAFVFICPVWVASILVIGSLVAERNTPEPVPEKPKSTITIGWSGAERVHQGDPIRLRGIEPLKVEPPCPSSILIRYSAVNKKNGQRRTYEKLLRPWTAQFDAGFSLDDYRSIYESDSIDLEITDCALESREDEFVLEVGQATHQRKFPQSPFEVELASDSNSISNIRRAAVYLKSAMQAPDDIDVDLEIDDPRVGYFLVDGKETPFTSVRLGKDSLESDKNRVQLFKHPGDSTNATVMVLASVRNDHTKLKNSNLKFGLLSDERVPVIVKHRGTLNESNSGDGVQVDLASSSGLVIRSAIRFQVSGNANPSDFEILGATKVGQGSYELNSDENGLARFQIQANDDSVGLEDDVIKIRFDNREADCTPRELVFKIVDDDLDPQFLVSYDGVSFKASLSNYERLEKVTRIHLTHSDDSEMNLGEHFEVAAMELGIGQNEVKAAIEVMGFPKPSKKEHQLALNLRAEDGELKPQGNEFTLIDDGVLRFETTVAESLGLSNALVFVLGGRGNQDQLELITAEVNSLLESQNASAFFLAAEGMVPYAPGSEPVDLQDNLPLQQGVDRVIQKLDSLESRFDYCPKMIFLIWTGDEVLSPLNVDSLKTSKLVSESKFVNQKSSLPPVVFVWRGGKSESGELKETTCFKHLYFGRDERNVIDPAVYLSADSKFATLISNFLRRLDK